ncbi:FIVAR domain-containing protein [Staphylococcus aureus]|nr:FIVAR domain-containing protein [Staphylococcus aureus]
MERCDDSTKAAIADKERTKASGNYVNADQEKRQAYDSKVTNAENIINGTPNATLTVNDVNSAASQVNAAKTALMVITTYVLRKSMPTIQLMA